MKDLVIDIEAEKNEILKRYRALLRASKSTLQKGDKRMIRKAFDMALESHKDMRRKSGEPYIYHPIAVAQIAAEDNRKVQKSSEPQKTDMSKMKLTSSDNSAPVNNNMNQLVTNGPEQDMRMSRAERRKMERDSQKKR